MNETLNVSTYNRDRRHRIFSFTLSFTSLFAKGNLSCYNLAQCGAKSPDVTLSHRFNIFLKTLWRHIGHCTTVFVIKIIAVYSTTLSTDTKIGQRIVACVIEQNISWFHILMDNRRLQCMQISQARCYI